MEFGAHRNFDALRLAVLKEEKEVELEKEEEKLNPMKLLENRTKQSKEEMDEIEKLGRLLEENTNKQSVDVNELIDSVNDEKDEKRLLNERLKAEEAEDERVAKALMQEASNRIIHTEIDSNSTKLITNSFFAKNSNNKSTSFQTNDSGDTSSRKRKIEGLIAIKRKEELIQNEKKEDKKPKLISSLCSYSDSSEEDC